MPPLATQEATDEQQGEDDPCALRCTPDECEANAICCGIAPDIFELDDDDNLHILKAEVPGRRRGEGAPRHQLLPQARAVRALIER